MIVRTLAFSICLINLAGLSPRLAWAQDHTTDTDSQHVPHDRWHLKTPFWRSSVVHGESVLFVQEADGERPAAKLLLTPARITKVRMANHSQTFEEGQDFEVNLALGRLELPKGSRIPFLKAGELFPPANSPRGINHNLGDSTRQVLFDQQHWFHDQEVEITYAASRQKQGYQHELAATALS